MTDEIVLAELGRNHDGLEVIQLAARVYGHRRGAGAMNRRLRRLQAAGEVESFEFRQGEWRYRLLSTPPQAKEDGHD